MVLGVSEFILKGPMVRVNGRDRMGMCGIWVCIRRRLAMYWFVNSVQRLSGQ